MDEVFICIPLITSEVEHTILHIYWLLKKILIHQVVCENKKTPINWTMKTKRRIQTFKTKNSELKTVEKFTNSVNSTRQFVIPKGVDIKRKVYKMWEEENMKGW